MFMFFYVKFNRRGQFKIVILDLITSNEALFNSTSFTSVFPTLGNSCCSDITIKYEMYQGVALTYNFTESVAEFCEAAIEIS